MPLPFLIAGAAVLAGGYGVKKGFDAKEDFDDAEKYNRWAEETYDEAKDDLEESRDNTQHALESLGKLKFEVYRDTIFPFIEAYDKIEGLEEKKTFKSEGKLSNIEQIAQMKETSLELQEVIGGGIASLGAGGIAGLASYGSIGLLGTASTGTAIGGLSGVAATNATLAWLGGGSLATGGFGMAGGAAVLGGIVAGPVLAVGGMMLSSKAEAAKDDASANYDQARLAATEMKTAQVITEGIEKRFNELSTVLNQLNKLFQPLLSSLVDLSNTNTNSATYTKKEDDIIDDDSTVFALSIKNLLEVQVLDKDGNVTQESKNIIENSSTEIASIEVNQLEEAIS